MTTTQMIKRVAVGLAILAGTAFPAHAAQVTFNFTSGSFSGTIGPYGNTRSFTGSDGTTKVITEGWGVTGTSGTTIQTGWLGQYGSFGLGVTDRQEGTGTPNTHTVDNGGYVDLVSFTFNNMVDAQTAFLNPFPLPTGTCGVCDSDISIWIGTVAGAYGAGGVNLSGLTLAQLVSTLNLTKLPNNTTSSSAARTATFNSSNLFGNILIISAATPNPDTTLDAFKIKNTTVYVPEPGIVTIFGIGLLALGARRRRAIAA